MQISKFRSFQITTALDSSLTRVHVIFFLYFFNVIIKTRSQIGNALYAIALIT